MNLSRREFFLMWTMPVAEQAEETMIVEILEVFQGDAGPCALLVHHSGQELRQDFSLWLHRFDGAQIELQTQGGTAVWARIFRVKMCFGRGLLLLPEAVNFHVKDKIRITVRSA